MMSKLIREKLEACVADQEKGLGEWVPPRGKGMECLFGFAQPNPAEC